MPYFHATAVFEVRSFSAEEVERRAATLFAAANNQHIHHYEHDTNEEAEPSSPSGARYFTLVADFDVEAQSEEHASDLIEQGFDALTLDNLQYVAHGLTEGEQRVYGEPTRTREETRFPQQDADKAPPPPEERGDRRRRSRGRRRGRSTEQESRATGTREARAEPSAVPDQSLQEPTGVPAEAHRTGPTRESVDSETHTQTVPVESSTTAIWETHEQEQPLSPPRSSSLMRVTLSVALRASELSVPTNGSSLPHGSELVALATAEARRRHPDLPDNIAPRSETTLLPWGDTMLTLTWHYDVPVPSASEAV